MEILSLSKYGSSAIDHSDDIDVSITLFEREMCNPC